MRRHLKHSLFVVAAVAGIYLVTPPFIIRLLAAPIDGLTFHISFESDGSDSTANNVDFTCSPAPDFVAGKVGGGADFEQDDADTCSHSDDAFVSFGDDAMTIGLWYRSENLALTENLLYKIGTDGEYALQHHITGGLQFLMWGSAGFGDAGTATYGALSANTWYWIMAGYRPGANQIWISVNCGSETTGSQSVGFLDSTNPLLISTPAAGADGIVDDVSVWDADKASDCAALYNGGAGLAYPFTVAGSGPPLGSLRLLGVGR